MLTANFGVTGQMLREWLEGQMEAGNTVARFLPLYYLLRGRIPEALHAHARLTRSPVPGERPSVRCAPQRIAGFHKNATYISYIRLGVCMHPFQTRSSYRRSLGGPIF